MKTGTACAATPFTDDRDMVDSRPTSNSSAVQPFLPYFYLTLANEPPEEIPRRYLAQWTLSGVDQPGVTDDDDDSFELA